MTVQSSAAGASVLGSVVGINSQTSTVQASDIGHVSAQLATTGVSYHQQLFILALTLVAVGFLLMGAARRHHGIGEFAADLTD